MKTLALLLLLAAPASAQSFNIDVGDNNVLYPVPSASYGGAAGQPGVWNDVHHGSCYCATLVTLAGAPSSVTTSSTTSSSFGWPFGGLPTEDLNLMNDVQNLPAVGGPYTWTFSNLASGSYVLYTYAWAPDSATARTQVSVPGSPDGAQVVGGAWTGSPHAQFVTYALHHVDVSTGTLTVQVVGTTGSGSINGFQLVEIPNSTAFCFGDGSGTACPCAHVGTSGNGCPNFSSATGGHLASSGTASISADTLVLSSSSVIPFGPGLYFQGSSTIPGGAVFGNGVLCLTGATPRLEVRFADGAGTSASTVAIHVLGSTAAGDVRNYQMWFRDDPSYCPNAGFNLTNALQLTWLP